MRIPTAVLALTFIFCASGTWAAQKKDDQRTYQPPPPSIVATPLGLVIAGFDRDGDMIVTRAEFADGVARSFALADSDHDSKVSMIDLADWAEVALGNRSALPGPFDFDRDGNDSISREEFAGLFETRFAALDKDSDRSLRRSELVSFAAAPPLSREERRRIRGDEEGPPR